MSDAPPASPLPYSVTAADGNVVCDVRPDGATVRVLLNRRQVVGLCACVVICTSVLAGAFQFFRTVGFRPTPTNDLVGLTAVVAAIVGAGALLTLPGAFGTATFELDAHHLTGVFRAGTRVRRWECQRSEVVNVVAGYQWNIRYGAFFGTTLLRKVDGTAVSLGIGSVREARAIASSLRRALRLPDPGPAEVRSPSGRARRQTFGPLNVQVVPARRWLAYAAAAPVNLLAATAFDRWDLLTSSVPWSATLTEPVLWRVVRIVVMAAIIPLGAPIDRLRRRATLSAHGGKLILLETGFPAPAHVEWPLDAVRDVRAVASRRRSSVRVELVLIDGSTHTLVDRLSAADADWLAAALRPALSVPMAAVAAASIVSDAPPQPAADA